MAFVDNTAPLDISLPLTKFTTFNKLPGELRDEALKFVAREPRESKLRTNSQSKKNLKGNSISRQQKTPFILQVCRESRKGASGTINSQYEVSLVSCRVLLLPRLGVSSST